MTVGAAARRDNRTLVRVGWAAAVVIVVSTATSGLPDGRGAAIAVVVLTALALAPWPVVLDRRYDDVRLLTAATLVTGLSGAALDLIHPSGPGFILAYMSLAAMGLRLPRRVAYGAGALVAIATAAAEAVTSEHAVSAALDLAIGAAFLLAASAYAAVSREAHERAAELLAQQEATRAAEARSAALAERSRLARELHDILAHSMSGLSIQLEAANLLASSTSADPRLVDQLRQAQRLAREGMDNARSAVRALRGDAPPGPAQLEELVRQTRLATGVEIGLEVVGAPRPVPVEQGLTLYRTVQEALTNTARYAGRGARAQVTVRWAADSVQVDASDVRGDGEPRGIRGSGTGLAGLAERAALAGGHLESGPTPDGWRVHLTLPLPLEEEDR